jgi:hypothetical protein
MISSSTGNPVPRPFHGIALVKIDDCFELARENPANRVTQLCLGTFVKFLYTQSGFCKRKEYPAVNESSGAYGLKIDASRF